MMMKMQENFQNFLSLTKGTDYVMVETKGACLI